MTAMPNSPAATGAGWINRLPAAQSRNTAEPAINADWPSAASDSALPWPKRCSRSAGTTAWPTATRLTIEATASSVESTSELNNATEPVSASTTALAPISVSATATEA